MAEAEENQRRLYGVNVTCGIDGWVILWYVCHFAA